MKKGPIVRTQIALIMLLGVLALVWIGRAGADEDTAPDSVSKSGSNIPTGRADAVDAANQVCTAAPFFHDMPNMDKTFSFGGTASRRVIVLFQGEFYNITDWVNIQLTIDNVAQSGPKPYVITGPSYPVETHGFIFLSDLLPPGTHTARIQWADGGNGPGCAWGRSMIVLHQ